MRKRFFLVFLLFVSLFEGDSAQAVSSASVLVTAAVTVEEFVEIIPYDNGTPDFYEDDSFSWKGNGASSPVFAVVSYPDGEEFMIHLEKQDHRYAYRDFQFPKEEMLAMAQDHESTFQVSQTKTRAQWVKELNSRSVTNWFASWFRIVSFGTPFSG